MHDYDLCPPCYERLLPPHVTPEPLLSYKKVHSKITSYPLVSSMFKAAFDSFAFRPLAGWIDEGEVKWLSYEQVMGKAIDFGSGLVKLFGLCPGTHVAISASNSPEWVIADVAAIFYSLVVVPIHVSLSGEPLEAYLRRTDVSVVICEENALPKFAHIAQTNSFLKAIISIENGHKFLNINNLEEDSYPAEYMESVNLLMKSSPPVLPMTAVAAIGEKVMVDPYVNQEKSSLFTIVSTSGSTGTPKGSKFTNQLWRANISDFKLLTPDLLPLVNIAMGSFVHISEREVLHSTILWGGRIGITSDLDNLLVDIKKFAPSEVSSTPRFWNVVMGEFEKQLFIQKTIQVGTDESLIRKQLLKEFSGILGHRVQEIGVGGAAVSPLLYKFLKECFPSASVKQGYGSTEAGSIADSDGKLYYFVQHKLIDVPELGYFSTDKPFPRGELCIKSRAMVEGYYNQPEETAQSFDEEGFFHTGDVVELIGERQVKIIDRSKNIFKLSQGEFISPEPLENIYQTSRLVDQILITFGDFTVYTQTCVSAVIVPHHDVVMDWWKKGGQEEMDVKLIFQTTLFLDYLREELKSIAQKHGVRSYELPGALVIDTERWTIQNGFLTTSGKKCRPKLNMYYRERVNDALSKFSEELEKRKMQFSLMELVSKVINVPESSINKNGRFVDVGGDSLSAIRLVQLAKQELDVDLPIEQLYQKNFEELQALISKKVTINETLPTNEDLYHDAVLPSDIQPNTIRFESFSNVLLTGATGFLGAFILLEILKQHKECKVYCLVRRNQNQPSSQERLVAVLKKLKVWDDIPRDTWENRVVVIEGDVSKSDFGLPKQTLHELESTVDVIYHCGAMVNSVLPYHLLKPHNVDGTINIIRFSTQQKQKLINFISTISIFPPRDIMRMNNKITEHHKIFNTTKAKVNQFHLNNQHLPTQRHNENEQQDYRRL
uniref:Carrier domain-containing protein n=1 Tax=Arcella intermedia TaxID=1963864 RepID=A0A6B2KX82_9EUKA